VKSAVKLGIALILLGALAVLVGRHVGVLGIAVTALAVILVLAARLATDYLAARERQQGPVVLVLPGQVIPADGEVVEGTALVDEFALTGSSSAVLREPGGECSAALGGTRVLSGRILVRLSRAD
jgi:high-affinity K+ transport system ATPase subunit B